MTRIIGIVARSENNAIGVNGNLPFSLKGDMAHFKSMTDNYTVLMGRKTLESIGRKLPNRTNIVVTKKGIVNIEDQEGLIFVMYPDLFIKGEKKMNLLGKVFIIGGEQLFNDLKDLIDEYYITEVGTYVDGDTFFNNSLEKFDSKLLARFEKDDDNEYPFEIFHYTRIED